MVLKGMNRMGDKIVIIKYLRIAKVEFEKTKEYFLNFIGQIIYLPMQFLLIYFLWKFVYSYNSQIGNNSFNDMIEYYLILTIVQSAIMPVGIITYEEWNDINQGNLNLYLSKPLFYPFYLCYRKIVLFLWNIIFGILFLIFANITILPWLKITLYIYNISLFILSSFFGFMIMFNLFFIVGTLTFWVENVLTLRDNVWNMIKIFSGEILPIAIFPSFIKKISVILPFQYIYYTPISVLQGKLTNEQLLDSIGFQIFWVIFMSIISLIMWKKGSVNYTSQGG